MYDNVVDINGTAYDAIVTIDSISNALITNFDNSTATNGKHYVVHGIHSTRPEADMAESAVNNKGNRAWILRSALRKL